MGEESLRISTSEERESIAESNIKEQIFNVLRSLDDELRELMLMIRDLDEGKEVAVQRRYSRIKNIKDSIESASINLMEYIIRASPVLTSKDVYAAITQNLHRIAEHIEAAAYRSLLISSGEFTRMSDSIYAMLDEVVKKVMGMVRTVSDMLNRLSSSEKLLHESYVELIKAESSVDEFYREAGIEIIKYYANKDVGALLLVKELFDKIEEAADLLARVGTYIRYLSIQK